MSSLVVRHHSATYRLPAEGNPGVDTAVLDEACSTLLTTALSSMSLGQGAGVWLIRHLEVKSSALAHWSPEVIARNLANQIASALRETLARGPDGLNVLWFPSRAAYLARLLVEVAEGSATRAWYFTEFSELLSRECGDLLLALCHREPESVREAICYLLPLEERLLLKHVSAAAADPILHVLAQWEPAPSLAALEAALAPFEQLARSGDLVEGSAALGFQIYVSAMRSEPRAGALALAQASLQIATLAATLGLAGHPTAAVQAWVARDWETLKRELGSEGVARIAVYEPVPSEIRQRLAKVAQDGPPTGIGEDATTPFGGLFLLLPYLDLFDWQGCLGECPGLDGHDPVQIGQLLTIVGCLGARKARRVFDDPVLRRCLGIDAQLTLLEISEWYEALPGRSALSERWVSGLERTGSIGSSSRTLAASPNGPMLVDGLKGIWMGRATGWPLVDIAQDEAAIHLGALLPPELTELVMMTSQALLREFAWRLPGFAASSIPFLHENFLEFPATVADQDDKQLVFVGNPPLHVLLSLTGMNRKRFVLPYSGGLEWILASRS